MTRTALRTLLCAASAGLLATVAAWPGPGAHAAAIVDVGTADELRDALADARPGDVIVMADGGYDGRFTITVDGTGDRPITLRGGRSAVLDGGDHRSGYGLHLDGADHWRLEGFTVTGSQKGVMTDDADHNVVDGLYVHHVGDEAIHLRTHSSGNVVRDTLITDTGLREPRFGEGLYVGSAVSNWDRYTNGQPDRSDRNRAIGNTIGPGVPAEMIDLKEGTRDGVVRGNVFDGRNLCCASYHDSWVDAKGNGYLIEDNTGTSTTRDGFQTHEILEGWGRDNVFTANDADVGGSGYGFAVFCNSGDACGNIVYDDNTVRNAGSGYANIPVTPGDDDDDDGDDPPPGDGCLVEYTVNNHWSSGLTATVRITNTGDAQFDGWTLEWTFPDGQRVTNHWRSIISQNGADVTAESVYYNRRIGPGANETFGFTASHDGLSGEPSSFSLNGLSCDVA